MEKKSQRRNLHAFHQAKKQLIERASKSDVNEEINKQPSSNESEKLIQLAELLNKGLLTEQEFLEQKETILKGS